MSKMYVKNSSTFNSSISLLPSRSSALLTCLYRSMRILVCGQHIQEYECGFKSKTLIHSFQKIYLLLIFCNILLHPSCSFFSSDTIDQIFISLWFMRDVTSVARQMETCLSGSFPITLINKFIIK